MVTRATRGISWIKAAQRAFEEFPEDVRLVCLRALTIAAEGGKADAAKPLRGMGSGVFEVALPCRGDAFRLVYAVQLADEVLGGSCLPEEIEAGYQDAGPDIRLVRDRLKALKEMLR